MTTHSATCVLALLSGAVAPFRAQHERSAIAKQLRPGQVAIGPLGLAGDEQADRVSHGGPDKALHHYAFDHYPLWRGVLGDLAILAAPGAFGENIATLGLTESDVCLGDRFRLGTALIEVSHGRQPCWKLGHRFAEPKMPAMVVSNGCGGWYYRVIEPGIARAGDDLALVDRVRPQWSVARMFGLVVAGGHKREAAALRELAAEPLLAASWRRRGERLLAN